MKRRLPSKRASILLLAALAVLISGWLSWKPLLLRHRIAWARSALEARDAGTALQWLQANERLEPNHAETHFWLARANRRLGQFGKVRDHLERAWKLGHSVEALKREQWLALAQSGRLDKAEPRLAGLLQDPRNDGREICEAYVAGYLLNYRFAPAFQLLDAWRKDFPEDAYPDLIRGRIYEGQLHAKKALTAYREALQLDENLKEARLRLANLLTSQHQHEEAVAHYQRSLNDDADNSDVLAGWSRRLAVLGRHQEARQVLERVLKREPKHFEARTSMAELELSDGRPKAALRWLEPALKEVPHDRAVRYALARTLQRLGRKAEASAHFEYVDESRRTGAHVQTLVERLDRDPANVELRYEIGMNLLKYENPADAAVWLNSVVQINPRHRKAHEALAAHYRKHGPAELAERHRKRAEQLKRTSNGSQ